MFLVPFSGELGTGLHCRPKKQGGLGLKQGCLWNKALVCKQIWSLASKADTLWVKWTHEKYIKQGTVSDCIAHQGDSWHWKKLMGVKELFQSGFSNGVWLATSTGEYTPNTRYVWLLGPASTFPLTKAVWCRFNVPKCGFILWLVGHGKLLTRDRLSGWNVAVAVADPRCLLCRYADESVAHLYFQCPYSRDLGAMVAQWLDICNMPYQLSDWMHWLEHMACGCSARAKMRTSVLTTFVALMWKERNSRLHGRPG